MKRRSFLFSVLASIPLVNIYKIWASEVKNAPKEPRQYKDIQDFGDEIPFRCLVLGDWGTGGSLQKDVALGMNTYAEKNPITLFGGKNEKNRNFCFRNRNLFCFRLLWKQR